MMIPEILGQILSFVATALMALSYQINNKNRLLLVQSAGTLCTTLSYLLLGATSGFALNIVCLLRNGAFFFHPRLPRGVRSVSTAVFTLAMCAVGALSWQGAISLLIIVALAINTCFLSMGNAQRLRYSIILTSSMIFVYNIAVFSMGGMLSEGISVVSSAIGIVRYRQRRGTQEQK